MIVHAAGLQAKAILVKLAKHSVADQYLVFFEARVGVVLFASDLLLSASDGGREDKAEGLHPSAQGISECTKRCPRRGGRRWSAERSLRRMLGSVTIGEMCRTKE